MKKLITLLLFAFIFQYSKADLVPFEIIIDHAIDQKIAFTYQKYDNAGLSTFVINLQAGKSNFYLDLPKNLFVVMDYMGIKQRLFVEIGDNLFIKFDGRLVHKTIQFAQKGAVNNNFLKEYQSKFSNFTKKEYQYGFTSFDIDYEVAKKAKELTFNAYFSFLENRSNAGSTFLKNNPTTVSSELKKYLEKDFNYNLIQEKVIWFIEHLFEFDTKEINAKKDQIQLNNFVQEIDESHKECIQALNAFVLLNYLPNDLAKHRIYIRLFETSNQVLQRESKCYYQNKLFESVNYHTGNIDLIQKFGTEYMETCGETKYGADVQENFGKHIIGVKNSYAPDFEAVTENHEIINLSDYKGKVVYLDFWASWCKPCIAGFKKYDAIRAKLEEMGVVLLNVSIDKKEKPWLTALDRYKPRGKNVLVLSFEDIYKKYDISSVPLYFILDKNGKFVSLDPNGNRNIILEFKKLLDK